MLRRPKDFRIVAAPAMRPEGERSVEIGRRGVMQAVEALPR